MFVRGGGVELCAPQSVSSARCQCDNVALLKLVLPLARPLQAHKSTTTMDRFVELARRALHVSIQLSVQQWSVLSPRQTTIRISRDDRVLDEFQYVFYLIFAII